MKEAISMKQVGIETWPDEILRVQTQSYPVEAECERLQTPLTSTMVGTLLPDIRQVLVAWSNNETVGHPHPISESNCVRSFPLAESARDDLKLPRVPSHFQRAFASFGRSFPQAAPQSPMTFPFTNINLLP